MLRFLLLALVSHAQSQSNCSDWDNGATDFKTQNQGATKIVGGGYREGEEA